MYLRVVVVHIRRERLVVQLILHLLHPPQRPDIVGVFQRYAIFRLGEIAQYQLAVFLRLGLIAHPHKHQIEIVIGVEAVDIVGVTVEQRQKFILGRGEILHLVLEYDAHIIQALLHDVVGRLLFGIGLGNLLEVIFGIVRVGFALHGLLIRSRSCGVGGCFGAFFRRVPLLASFGSLIRTEVIEGECLLVATAPVILQFSVAPPALEFRTPGILHRLIVEIPGIVAGVHREHLILLVLEVVLVAVCHILLALNRFSSLFFLLFQLVDDFVHHLKLLLGSHRRQAEQGILQLHILRIHGQLVEHVASTLECSVIGIIIGELRHSLRIAGLCLGIEMAVVVKSAQGELRQGLVDARPG